MKHKGGGLGLPLALWLGAFLILPVAFVAIYSLLKRGAYGEVIWTLSLHNYARAMDGLYLGIFAKSLMLAALTTGVCMIIGFPLAYTIATASKTWRSLLLAVLMVPFLTNFVVRVYAIRVILGVEGPINRALIASGLLTEPLMMTDSLFAVAVGMVTNYLPFMTLPIYVVLEAFDFSLLEAAADLGARGWTILFKVILPLSRQGLISGATLVFIPVLGEYMIPDLLGGARTMLLGNLITEQFLKARDWPFGAAVAMRLIFAMGGSFAVQRALAGKGATLAQA